MSKPTVSFEDWFDAKKIKHFTADEFTSYFRRTRNGVRNAPPPVAMWENMVPTLRVVDDLRRYFKKPIVLLSSYRNSAYNKAVGGASASIHMKFNALDIAVAGVAPSEVFRVLRSWRAAGRFVGGIGLYETFVHVDTRGYNATW